MSTLWQRRTSGSVDFRQPLNEYRKGFGNLEDNYWIGKQLYQ